MAETKDFWSGFKFSLGIGVGCLLVLILFILFILLGIYIFRDTLLTIDI